MSKIHTKTLPAVICTTDTATEVLGVSRSRVRQLVKDGRLDAWSIGDRVVLLDYHQVERFAKEPRRTGRPRGGAVLD